MTLDILLMLFLAAFVAKGFFEGFIKMVGSLVGLVIAIYISVAYAEVGGIALADFIHISDSVAKMVAGVVIFIAVSAIVSLFVWLLKKTWGLIPLGTTVDRIGGAVAGLVEGALVVGFVLQLILTSGVKPEWSEQIATSTIAPALLGVTSLLWPLVKEKLKELQVMG